MYSNDYYNINEIIEVNRGPRKDSYIISVVTWKRSANIDSAFNVTLVPILAFKRLKIRTLLDGIQIKFLSYTRHIFNAVGITSVQELLKIRILI